jgi:hypothetical protein
MAIRQQTSRPAGRSDDHRHSSVSRASSVSQTHLEAQQMYPSNREYHASQRGRDRRAQSRCPRRLFRRYRSRRVARRGWRGSGEDCLLQLDDGCTEMLVYLHTDERYNIKYNRFTSPTLWVSTASLRSHVLSLQVTFDLRIKLTSSLPHSELKLLRLCCVAGDAKRSGLTPSYYWLYALLLGLKMSSPWNGASINHTINGLRATSVNVAVCCLLHGRLTTDKEWGIWMTSVKYVLLFIIVPCFKVRASEYTGALDRFALVDWRTSPISTQKIASSRFPDCDCDGVTSCRPAWHLQLRS